MSCVIDTANLILLDNISEGTIYMDSHVDLNSLILAANKDVATMSMHDYINIGVLNLCNFVSLAILNLGVNIDTQSLYTCFTVVNVSSFTYYPFQWFNNYFNEGFK